MAPRVSSRPLPTAINVSKLYDFFGIPQEGAIIEYSMIAEVLGFGRESIRWYSVCRAWKDRLEREGNLILRTLHGQGFQVCSPENRIDIAGNHYKLGVRKIARAAQIAATTDRTRLDANQKNLSDFLQLSANKIELALSAEKNKKALTLSTDLQR